MTFKRHLLVTGALLAAALAFIVVRNWGTFALIYDNATAMNEGQQVAQQVRYPSDLLTYIKAHPERVSLVAYDAGQAGAGVFFQAEQPRPTASLPNLMVVAEYARRAAAGQLHPEERVPLRAMAPYALPGAGAAQHDGARTQWRTRDLIGADSTVALRHVIRAIAQQGDRAATDWFMDRLGRAQVEMLPERFGLEGAAPPHPSSGMHLSWNHHAAAQPVEARVASYRTMPADAYADRVYELTGRLRHDATFREREQKRLRQRGTDISLRQQRALAQVTYPQGTAATYARWMSRLAQDPAPSDSASAFVQRHLEQTVRADSLQVEGAPSTLTIGSKAGAVPGIISFAGYVRHSDGRPPRVVALLMEDVPIGLFYHLMQTSLDRGFYLQLLTDDTFFQTVRTQLSNPSVAAR